MRVGVVRPGRPAGPRAMNRLRDVQKAVAGLFPKQSPRDVRVRGPELRRNWAVYKVEYADGMDVGGLCARFPEARVHLRDGGSNGSCVEVSLPIGAVNSHRLGTVAALCRAAAGASAVVGLVGLLFY